MAVRKSYFDRDLIRMWMQEPENAKLLKKGMDYERKERPDFSEEELKSFVIRWVQETCYTDWADYTPGVNDEYDAFDKFKEAVEAGALFTDPLDDDYYWNRLRREEAEGRARVQRKNKIKKTIIIVLILAVIAAIVFSKFSG